MKRKISVALTTYNGSKYIVEQLKSICKQTFLPDEIVICDDCSNDNTIEIIKQFSLQSPIKIKIHQNSINIGPRKNFEKCIQMCKGDILFFCDQDDVWLKNKVERMVNEFDNKNVVFVFSDGYVTDSELNVIRDSEWSINWAAFSTQEYFNFCQTRNFPLGHLQAIRRDVLEKMIPFLSDPDGWIAQCAPAFGEVVAIPDKLVYDRRHSGTVSTAFIEKRKFSLLKIIKEMWKTSYQEYFLWPKAEKITYNQIYEYTKKNGNKVNPVKLQEHLYYLSTLNNIENMSLFEQKKALESLYQKGIYAQYRGNRNTFKVDKLYLFINKIRGEL